MTLTARLESVERSGASQGVDYALIRQAVNDELKRTVGDLLAAGEVQGDDLEASVLQSIAKVLEQSEIPLSGRDRAQLAQQVIDDILGSGPLEQLLRDPSVSEIMVSGFNRIYVERNGELEPTSLSFQDEQHLRKTIERMVSRVGRRIDEASPMVDARLADGSRLNAVVAPIALDGSSLTIRKFFKQPFTAEQMLSTQTITPEALELLRASVRGRLNVVISGGTGSGKTTTLNVLAEFLPPHERIVTIEDSAELQLNKPHVVRLETRPSNIEGGGLVTIRDLVRNALRMRPDRIVIGEVRDGAALDMLQAMNTGHDGSLTTLHANSTMDAVSRLETMALMAGMSLPVSVIREQIARAVHLIVQQTRLSDGSRRVTAISEVAGMQSGQLQLRDVFRAEAASGQLRATEHLALLMQKLAGA